MKKISKKIKIIILVIFIVCAIAIYHLLSIIFCSMPIYQKYLYRFLDGQRINLSICDISQYRVEAASGLEKYFPYSDELKEIVFNQIQQLSSYKSYSKKYPDLYKSYQIYSYDVSSNEYLKEYYKPYAPNLVSQIRPNSIIIRFFATRYGYYKPPESNRGDYSIGIDICNNKIIWLSYEETNIF